MPCLKVLSFFRNNKLAITIGFVLSVGIFSPYIFGQDNLAEELAELFIYKETGIFVDFTPSSKEEVTQDFQTILDLSRQSGWVQE